MKRALLANLTQTRLASDTADSLLWEKYTNPASHSVPATVQATLSRITFTNQRSARPLHAAVELVQAEITGASANNALAERRSLIVLVGRSRRMAVHSLTAELRELVSATGSTVGSSVPKTLGDVGAALVASNVDASLLVLQASSGN